MSDVRPHEMPSDEPQISFAVSYSRAEYLSFVHEHVSTFKEKRARAQGGLFKPHGSILNRALITIVASSIFLIKKHRMPLCEFEIDAKYIRRKSRQGLLCVPWAEVTDIHRYSQGYLVVDPKGAMPLPYRCLSQQQSKALVRLVDAWEQRFRRAA